jgi:isoamylase
MPNRSSARWTWSDAHFGYRVGHRLEDLSFDRRDSAAGMLKCQVIDPAFTWGDDRPPAIPWHDTVIHELHVKGFTQLHPEVPPTCAAPMPAWLPRR